MRVFSRLIKQVTYNTYALFSRTKESGEVVAIFHEMKVITYYNVLKKLIFKDKLERQIDFFEQKENFQFN